MRTGRLGLAGYACAWTVIAAAAFGSLPALAEGASGTGTGLRCGERNVIVHSRDRRDASTVCEGARDAIAFLVSQGLDVSSEVEIEVVPRLPAAVGPSAAGCYLDSRRRVLILAYSEFENQKPWLGLPADRTLYRSVAAHEVAHAIAACNFKMPKPPISATEYIAYVAMLATMDAATRQQVLSQFSDEPFAGDWQMTSTIYMLDPERFGVRAYRHFLQPGNGRRYLQEMLSGNVMVE